MEISLEPLPTANLSPLEKKKKKQNENYLAFYLNSKTYVLIQFHSYTGLIACDQIAKLVKCLTGDSGVTYSNPDLVWFITFSPFLFQFGTL